MLDKFSFVKKNILISIVIIVTAFVGLFGGTFNQAASILYPAAGVYTAFYFLHRKQVLPGILISIFLVNLIFRLMMSDELFYISIMLSILFTVSNFLEAIIFSFLMDNFKMRQIKGLNLIEIGKFLSISILSGLIGATTGTFAISIFYGFDEFLSSFIFWWLGSSTGILVFSGLIINAHFHDKNKRLESNDLIRYALYLLVFSLVVILVFTDFGPNFFDFQTSQIIFVFLFVIAAFILPFKIITLSLLFLISFINIIYIPKLDGDVYAEVLWLIIFIIGLESLSSIIKLLLLGYQDNYLKMKIAKNNLERIIYSTNDLLLSEDNIPEEEREFSIKYLINMFEIACEIYPNFDKASCSIKGDKYVDFVAAKGYNIEHLNSLNFINERFMWSLYAPEIVKNTDYNRAFEVNNNAKEFVNQYGNLKESIRFTVIIGENDLANMSFDIYDNSNHNFTERDLENFKSFQTLMNSYFKVGILKTETENLKDDIMLSLVRTLELYDRYTGGHSEQVAELSVALAKRLNIPKDQLLTLYWAGIVHDIGKVGVPYHIINKKGKLTKEEYRTIQEHPVHGYDILRRSKSLLNIAEIVLHHHEWWNGQGYPDALSGNDIPYLSQILHVCDAVDAMAQDRVYRSKLSDEDIINQLEKGMGKQFNPEVAEEMISYIKEGLLS